MQLSAHFSELEILKSETAIKRGINNTFTVPEHRQNIIDFLNQDVEKVRIKWGKPITITSGYRSAALNRIIRGASPTSAHAQGRAIDFVTDTRSAKDLADLFDLIISMWDNDEVRIDQLIWEDKRATKEGLWVHWGVKALKPGITGRGQILKYRGPNDYPAIDRAPR